MAETLGTLCDKLTIIKLKQFHSEDSARLESLSKQEDKIKNEIDQFVAGALNGLVSIDNLSFETNKIFKKEGNETKIIEGDFGELFALLAEVNCNLWHEQEKVYEFEKVPADDKDKVVKRLAILNLERNKCIDGIDKNFKELIIK